MDMPTYRDPFFIIAGAMKSGTTWLHDALNELPEIQIPREEIHWIDAMDPTTHPDFQQYDRHGLRLATSEESNWFVSYAQGDPSKEMLGYDSTTLFHSKVNLARIAKMLPGTKFIVILRDPVERAYSHYWHLVRTGRARFRFEKELLNGKHEILDKSIYLDQVHRFLLAFDNRVHFICHERMFAEPQVVLSGLLEFLGLPDNYLDLLLSRLDVRSNPGRYPRFLAGWLLGSKLLTGMERGRYARDVGQSRHSTLAKIRYGAYRVKLGVMATMGVGVIRCLPPMKRETRRSLTYFLQEANSGLDELLDGTWSQWWYRNE